MSRARTVPLLVVALAWVSGCGSKPAGGPTAAVTGTVTLDTKAVPAGEISFETSGAPPKVLEIKDGDFSGEVPVGKHKVHVYIYAEGQKQEKYGGAANKTNVAPQKYWGPNTTLSAEVAAGGTNDFKFDMRSSLK